MKSKWVLNLHREGWIPPKNGRVCSDHFSESQIKREGQRVTLKRGAEPTRFKGSPGHNEDPLSKISHDHTYHHYQICNRDQELPDEEKDILLTQNKPSSKNENDDPMSSVNRRNRMC